MTHRFRGSIAVALVFVVTNVVAQSKPPDFTGDWRTSGAATPPAALSIVQDGTQVAVTERGLAMIFRLDGTPTLYNLDGTLAPAGTQPDDAGVKTSAEWIGAKLQLTRDVKGPRSFTIVDIYELSGDGQTLTRDSATAIADLGPNGTTKQTSTYVK